MSSKTVIVLPACVKLAVYQMATRDGVSYLVEELLDGETLSDRLRRGPDSFTQGD